MDELGVVILFVFSPFCLFLVNFSFCFFGMAPYFLTNFYKFLVSCYLFHLKLVFLLGCVPVPFPSFRRFF